MTRQLLHRYDIHFCVRTLRIAIEIANINSFATRPVHPSHHPARAIAPIPECNNCHQKYRTSHRARAIALNHRPPGFLNL
ncbi:hypothetical protein QUB47_07710 [Microcoleus sp. AT9_B5]